MYSLPHFKEKDASVVLEFMKQHSFATLICVDAEQKPVATQIPFLFAERGGTFVFTWTYHERNRPS